MAPPANRRTGFSRRAQYGLFFSYVIAGVGVMIAVLLLGIAIIDPRGFQALKGVALDITTPISSAANSVVSWVGGVGESISEYFGAASENADLRRALQTEHNAVVQARAVAFENVRLRQMLALRDQAQGQGIVTRIVGSSFSSPRRTATLSVGTSSGVEVGQPVRAPDGLIGRVIETGRWASRVLLITDGASTVPVRLVRGGLPALAVGRGDGYLDLHTLEVGVNPFRRGDLLATSGIGGIYPPNVPVAEVVSIHGDTAVARPLADPARLDFALVERIFQSATSGPLDPGHQTQGEHIGP